MCTDINIDPKPSFLTYTINKLNPIARNCFKNILVAVSLPILRLRMTIILLGFGDD